MEKANTAERNNSSINNSSSERKAGTIWLVTGELAEKSIASLVAKFPNVRTLVAPVSVASFLTSANVRKIVHDNPAMLSGIIVIPGTVRWDIAPLENELNAIIVKGPRNVAELHQFIKGVVKVSKEHPAAPRQEISRLVGALKKTREQEQAGYVTILQERASLLDREPVNFNEQERKSGESRARSASAPSTTTTTTTVTTTSIVHEENLHVLPFLKQPGRNFRVAGSRFVIGKDFPPAIMAEIINAAGKPEAEIDTQVEYFLSNGADIIDVGATPGKQEPEALGSIVESIKHRWKCMTSIDSLDGKEIVAAVDRGASIVLSIDEGNLDILPSLDKKIAIVVIPTNMKAGTFPRSPQERVSALARVITKSLDLGFTRIIADPILNSPINPGLLESLDAYTMFSRAAKEDARLDVPVLLGGSNVSEMIDTDSTGVNAILAVIGAELGAGILFTSEDSAKCIGSVKELRAARDMTFMARLKGVHPKDLPFDAFNVKRKHKTIPSFDIPVESANSIARTKAITGISSKAYVGTGATIIDADAPASLAARGFRPDPSGTYFKIMVDHFRGKIFAGAFTIGGLVHVFQGKTAERIGKEVLTKHGNLSQDHVLYIGRELARAEDCLMHGAVYVQDET